MRCHAPKLQNLLDGDAATGLDSSRNRVIFVVLLRLDAKTQKGIVILIPLLPVSASSLQEHESKMAWRMTRRKRGLRRIKAHFQLMYER